MFKELLKAGPKYGAGFSRVLSKMDKPEILELIVNKKRNLSIGQSS